MLKPTHWAFALLVAVAPALTFADEWRVDLAGQWQVHLDRSHTWPAALPSDAEFAPVRLPGALRDSGLGDPVGPATQWIGLTQGWDNPVYAPFREPGNFKVPFWLQPERHFVGPAWYKRTVKVPDSWRGRRIVLELERPHWYTRQFVDSQEVGHNDSLSVPHVYDVTRHLPPGEHTLMLMVSNTLRPVNVGYNSHSVSDHTQTAWHGVVGAMELRSTPAAWVEHVKLEPDAAKKAVGVSVTLGRLDGTPGKGTLTIEAKTRGKRVAQAKAHIDLDTSTTTTHTLALGDDAALWDEFTPDLYDVSVTLESAAGGHTVAERFGLRSIATRGTQFVLNGRPAFFRGTLECCIFPLTGYPPTDVDAWRRIIRVCKAHGLNHIRFHSWCPPKAAFVAADEEGFYYQVECSTWPNSTTSLGNGRPIDEWLYREGQRVLDAYGNHPSFVLLCAGNEPAGPGRGGKYLGPWVDHFKSHESRVLVTSGAGWPQIAQSEFHVLYAPRIQGWGQNLKSRINALPPQTVSDYRDHVAKRTAPIISHEIGQWCVFPDFDEIAKYTGSLKAKNFEMFRHQLREAGLLDRARDFLMASGKLQALCYKEEVEAALRTPGFGGFQLLDLHDFPGQGTALVGVLDAFWDSKPYLTPKEFARFCGPVVPLTRLPRRVLTVNDTLEAQVEVYQFGPRDLVDAQPAWRIENVKGEVLARGTFDKRTLVAGALHEVGRLSVSLSNFAAPAKLKLFVAVGKAENDWDLWVYPSEPGADPEGVFVARSMDEALPRLEQGGRVLLLVEPSSVSTGVTIGFSPIFWNTNWATGQKPDTLGVLCDPGHPALAQFPTEYHQNWHWWELVMRSRAMELDALPADLKPIVQVVPDWNAPRKLGLVFEARVSGGRLLVCSTDLASELETRPVARQMRQSLLAYAASDRFSPSVTLSPEQLALMLAGSGKPAPDKLGLSVSDPESARPARPVSTRRPGFVVPGEVSGRPFASAAELGLVKAP